MSRDIKLLSWNVNGIRSAYKKGIMDWLESAQPDILCVQETKIQENQLDSKLTSPDGYSSYWAFAEKKGYSGVAVYSKAEPKSVSTTMGIERFDNEGRYLRLDYDDFILFNVYFPNGKMNSERLNFKMEFYEAFLAILEDLRKESGHLIFVGDVNTAHNEIDLARPKENSTVSGFLPIERAWMDKVVSLGYVDTFRRFYPDTAQYSWWDLKSGARKRNVGWRIDYVFVTEEMLGLVKEPCILTEVMGSDHCPVGVNLSIS